MNRRKRQPHQEAIHRATPRVAFWTGASCLALAMWWAWEVRIRNSWPTVEATVTTLRLKLGTNMVITKTGSQLEQTARFQFRYEYSVDGQTYSSSRFHPLGFPPNETYLTRHYPLGTRFRAHYNPAQPHRSFVEPGATSLTLILLGLGLVAYAGVSARWLRQH